MALKATSNKPVGPNTVFKATGRKSYDYSVVYGWERENKKSLDILNNYYDRINNGEWLSAEDRAAYKSALDSYIDSSTRLRNVGKAFGQSYTESEEKSWLDSVNAMRGNYDSANAFYSQFANDREYGVYKTRQDQYANYNAATESPDFDMYSGFVEGTDDFNYHYVNGNAGAYFQPYIDGQKPFVVGFGGVSNQAKNADERGYGEMTDEEIKLYNYYFKTQGREKAQEYLDFITDDLVRRKAGQEYEEMKGKSDLEKIFYGFTAGIESGMTGIENIGALITGEQGFTPSSQYVSGNLRNDFAGENGGITAGQVIYDLANTTGNMLPSIGVGAMTGGIGGALTMGMSSAGNSYNNLLSQGYTPEQARTYGILSGASEAALSYLLGGITKLGGKISGNVIGKIVDGLDNAIARTAVKVGGNMVSEGVEEALQEILDPVLKMAATGEEFEGIDFGNVFYSGLLGALSGGMLEGVPTIAGTALSAGATSLNYGASPEAVVAEAIKVNPESKVAQNAQKRIEKGKGVSGIATLSMLENIEKGYADQDTSKIKSAVVERLTELGEKGNIDKIAEILTKQAKGEKLTPMERKTLQESSMGYRVATEMDAENIRRGNMTESWAESIGTKRIGDGIYNRKASARVTTEGGTDTAISKIARVSEDGVTVELADGTEADAGKITFSDEKTELVFKTATERVGRVEGWTTETANAMIKAYEEVPTETPDRFIKGWTEAYDLGRSKGASSQLSVMPYARNLPESVRTRAYNIGSVLTETKAVKNTNKGSFTFEDSVTPEMQRGFSKKQKDDMNTLRIVSEALGINVRVFDSPVNAEGKRVGENGSYDPKTRTIRIDLHSGRGGEGFVAFTAAHELTHHMRAYAKDSFNKFADAVFNALGEGGVNVQELVEARIVSLRKGGRLEGLSESQAYDLAYEEVVADAAERMFADSDAIERLASELKAKDKSLWQRVKSFLENLVKRIKAAYARLNPDSYEGRKLKEVAKNYDEILKIWSDAVVEMSRAEDFVTIDTASESVSPLMLSERTWTASEYVTERNKMAEKIAKALGVSVAKAKKYIDDITSIAKMIADDRARLDYEASSFGSAFVSNVEYGGSFDYTTLCKKRRIYTGTFSEIQKRLHDVALTPDDILKIRNLMIEEGIEATCGLCYVEGSRANMGKFAKKFIELYKRDNPGAWIPTMADVNTPDGVEQMRINHPEVYERYEYFWNHYGKLKDSDPALFASQQKPKLYEARKEYKGEILKHFKGETSIDKKNRNGGIRMQSFSDFEIVHLIDTMQVIMDMSTVGLAGQAYTKVPEFAKAFGNTGLKINLSLIAKGVDADGKLIFDDREGMPHETAFDLRKKYSKNVGTIIVTFTDEQLLAAMADPRIDFIIPFHRSQWKKGQYGAMGLPKGTKDYTFMQNEKLIKQTYHEYQGRMVKDKASNYMPNDYWDFSKSGKENAESYLKMCAENNKRPKFYKLLDYDGHGTYSLKADGSTDGYWKLLIDFKMYDNNGAGSPQTQVVPNFNMDDARTMLDEYKGGHSSYPVAQGVVDKFVSEYNKENRTKYSDRDSNGSKLTKEQMEFFKDSKVRDENGNLLEVYHGTEKGGFTKFEISDDIGYFFTDRVGVAWTYSGTYDEYAPKRFESWDDAIAAAEEIGIDLYLDEESGKYILDGYSEWAENELYSIAEELKYYAEERKVNYSVYLNLKNPLIINGNGSNWNAVIDHTGTMVTYDELTDEQLEAIAENEGLDVEDLRGYTDDYGNELPVFDIDNKWISYPYSTREWVADARDGGYDGVIFKDISDDGKYGRGYSNESNVYVALESNQIKSTANKNPTDNSDIRYQDRKSDDDSFSNRSLLANALEGVAQTPMEKQKLAEYKEKIRELNVQSRKLYEINQEIKELTSGKGKKNPERLKALREEAAKTTKRINFYDKKLLGLEATKPLRDVLERETKKAYKEAAQKGREALHKNVEGRRKTEARHKIQRIAKELASLLDKGTKERNVKKGERGIVRAALDLSDMLFATDDEIIVNGVGVTYTDAEARAMDEYVRLYEEYHSYDGSVTEHKERRAFLRSQMTDLKHSFEGVIERERKRISEVKSDAIFEALVKEYEALQGAEESYIRDAFDKDTLEHIKALQQKVGGALVSEMTLEQLENVYKALKMVKTMVTDSNKLFKAGKTETVEKMGSAAMSEVEAFGHKEKFSKIGKVISKFGWDNLKPIYLMERTGSKTLQRLFQGILDGESLWATDMAEARAYVAEQKKSHGYGKWDLKATKEFSTNTGKTFKINLGQMLSIYAYSKRGEQALEHLRTDGFVYDETTEVKGKGGITYELNDKTAYKISDSVLLEILNTLTAEQKAYVDEMIRYLSETMGKKGNEVSNAMYGIDLFGEENYFPIRSERAYLERAREQAKGEVKIKNKGFTKPTQKGARNAIVLSDFNKLWSEHVAEMSSYHAFTLPLEDFYRVYNYQTKSDENADKRGVIPALDNAFGTASTQAIDQLLTDLNGGARSDPRETVAKTMLSLYKKAKVMASMSVVIQQPSSILRAEALIDPKYFAGKKIDKKKHKALWEEVKKYAPVAIIKDMGHFDVGMGKASADWLLDEKTVWDTIDDIASKPASYADEVTWVAIWNAVKRETASKNPTMNTSSEEFLKKAGERFEDVIRHTQVYDSTLSRSANMRSKSIYMQMATAFLAEPTTSINMREMALRSGDKRRIARTTAAVYSATLLNAVLVALPYAMRDDDEDETFVEKYITALTTSFVDGINPITAIPYLKDVWSIAQGYDIERADMSLASDVIDSIKSLINACAKDEADANEIFNKVLNLIGDISAFTGVPIDNVRRDVMSIINFGKTITRDIKGMDTTWRSLGDALEKAFRDETPILGWFKGESKGDRLYDALVVGDDKYVARFKATYKDESTYLSAVRKALRENDPRMREAAEAYLNKDYATYNALRNEIVKEGVFDMKLVTDALKAEINYLKQKANE